MHNRPAVPLMLNPAARVLWRSPDAVQLEVGGRAIVVEGMPSSLIALLADRSTSPLAQSVQLPHAPGLDAALRALAVDEYVWPRTDDPPEPIGPQLAGELTSLRGRHGPRAGRVLSRRAEATAVVRGTGRLAVAIATLLAAANVGRVHMHDSADVHRHDTAPGGLQLCDEGRRFKDAANDAVQRAAAGVDTTALGPDDQPDLVVLTGEAPTDPDVRSWLHARSIAHLAAHLGPGEVVVGPLVLPGLTSCLHCADCNRLDRDPAWSALAVQLCTPRRDAAPAEIALTSLAAGLTVVQALAYLDGDEPATLSGTLELRLPDWRVRRRSWPAHPDCGCGA